MCLWPVAVISFDQPKLISLKCVVSGTYADDIVLLILALLLCPS